MSSFKIFFLFIGLSGYSLALSCPGCPIDVDVNDPSVHKYLTKTLSGYHSAPTGTHNEQTILVKINKATSQIVSGVKYTYDFEAKGVKTHSLYECRLVILDQPWAGGVKVLENSCQPTSNRNIRSVLGRGIRLDQETAELDKQKIYQTSQQICPGCPINVDVNDPSVHKQLMKTLSGYHSAPTGTQNEQTRLVKINKATSQIVSGVKYTYDFEAKGVKTHSLYDCRLVILDQPWAGGEKILDYSCKPESSKIRA